MYLFMMKKSTYLYTGERNNEKRKVRGRKNRG